MQILVVFFLAAFVGCFGDNSQCLDNAESCVADFLQTILDESSEYKRCKELVNSIDCLETAVESCDGDEEDKVKGGIEELKKGKDELCGVQHVFSQNDEIQKCFEAHKEYVLECIMKSTTEVMEALEHLKDEEDIDDRIKCGLFINLAECTFNRVSEKCGTEAAEEALAHENLIPVEVKEACLAVGIYFTGPDGADLKKK